MPTQPQAVTERYVSNLLHNGQNREFYIVKIQMEPTVVNDTNIGLHFKVEIAQHVGASTQMGGGIGATIAQALRVALLRHGVTFR